MPLHVRQPLYSRFQSHHLRHVQALQATGQGNTSPQARLTVLQVLAGYHCLGDSSELGAEVMTCFSNAVATSAMKVLRLACHSSIYRRQVQRDA